MRPSELIGRVGFVPTGNRRLSRCTEFRLYTNPTVRHVHVGSNQRLQQIVQVAFQTFAEYEAMLARQAAGVVATPLNQVVDLGENDQFFGFLDGMASVVLANGRPKRMTAKRTDGDFQFSTRMRR